MTDGPALYGLNLFGDPVEPPRSGPVADRFVFPPFSVLDARAGDWQDRKAAWQSIGIESEVGRSDDLLMQSAGVKQFDHYRVKEGTRAETDEQGTSIFDPVLCELVYRWFSAPGAQVLDPFAGGSVRGIVAGALSRAYWGCDLRAEQVQANEAQADAIAPAVRPSWVCGDAAQACAQAPLADLVFSCPPYGDLEQYSDDPADLSTMDWENFAKAYLACIMAACARLKRDRFACFVVGDFRDEKGLYRNFPGLTIDCFWAAGLRLYNEAVLVTAVGTASMRVTRQFSAGRKFVKTHQNVLVFVKGDPKRAAEAAGEI